MHQICTRTWAKTWGMGLLLGSTLLPAAAQSNPGLQEAAAAWRFQVTPYVWMTGLDGRVRPLQRGPTLHVNNSFSELLKNLDAAFFLNATARKDRWVLHGDISHASISETEPLPYGLSAKAKIKQTSLSVLGGYTWMPAAQTTVDTMAGVRWWRIQGQVQVAPIAQAASRTSFADPVLALRWRQEWTPRWSTVVYGDVGGFGVGSHATWQALATVNYQFTPHAYVSLGYRHLSVDYRSDGKALDFSMAGPVLGVTWRF